MPETTSMGKLCRSGDPCSWFGYMGRGKGGEKGTGGTPRGWLSPPKCGLLAPSSGCWPPRAAVSPPPLAAQGPAWGQACGRPKGDVGWDPVSPSEGGEDGVPNATALSHG